MDQKERNALRLIEEHLCGAHSPIVAWSSGKDSMALLDLVRQIDKSVPVLFFREEGEPQKTEFAETVIRDWNLTVHTYRAAEYDIAAGSGEVEIISRYDAGRGMNIILPIGTDPHSEPVMCGVMLTQREKQTEFDYPWDVTFVGHRSEDVDPVQGAIPLENETAWLGNTLLVYPLRDWTTREVWTYHERRGLPYNERRYDRANDYAEFADRTYNNDYYSVCVRCVSPYEPETVWCPLLGREVENVSAQIDWQAKRDRWKLINIQRAENYASV